MTGSANVQPGMQRVLWTILWVFLAAATLDARAASPMLSSQDDHVLALSRDGKVFAWGRDARGQLGIGRPTHSATPRKVAGLPRIVHVAASTLHIAAADASGNVWTWGQDGCGQLGQRDPATNSSPGRVRGIAEVIQVAAAANFTVALRRDGTVWAWGGFGDCGIGTSTVPAPVAGLSGITAVSAGNDHLVALKSDGSVWTVGANHYGMLGDGTRDSRTDARQVAGLAGITAIAAGFATSVALRADGAVFAWGTSYPNDSGRLAPLPVAGLSDAVSVSGDGAVRRDGTAVTWDSRYQPAALPGFSVLSRFQTYRVSGVLHAGVRSDGTVVVAGRNAEGQGGLGFTSFSITATTVPGLAGVVDVAIAELGLLALTSAGDVYVWGSNQFGLLGAGDSDVSSLPLPVPGLDNVTKLAAGTGVSYALDAGGRVWSWGSNALSELGDGSLTPRSVPQLFQGLTDVIDIAAGCSLGVFLRGDGTVWYIGFPQGIGALPTTVLKQVPGLANIVSIAASCVNFFAIDASGKAYAWGDGNGGLIGDGSRASREFPILMTAFDSPVRAITANVAHALALTADGAVWSWGINTDGQLGTASDLASASLVPVRIGGLPAAVAVAAGRTHSLALLADGTVSSWGRFALGDGATTFRSKPGAVQLLSGIAAISAATQASYAVGRDGTVYGWGENTVYAPPFFFSSQVGDGTFATRNKPVLVLRDGARGNLDSGDWYLDLDATVTNALPSGIVPAVLPVARATLEPRSVSLSAAINFRTADQGKVVGTYVLGLVPPSFLAQVKLAPSMGKAQLERVAKSEAPVLVQLTPSGWATVSGQLVALSSGVVGGNSGASTILSNVNPATIPGARFCIGYGESATAMLAANALGEVLTLEGASSTAGGLPCVLSGVYVSGPASSRQGTRTAFTATVVGLSPTGSVQFRDQYRSQVFNLGAPLALTPRSEAVASASISTSELASGVHSIDAAYAGDGRNPAVTASLPLLHAVAAGGMGTTVVLSGPVSSVFGGTVVFVATVTGDAPTGTVQFRDGAANLGDPVPIFDGTATLSVNTLAVGAHAITALYGGDTATGGRNPASTSNGLTHGVQAALVTSVSLAASASSAIAGQTVTLRATVSGKAPTGEVTVRDGATVIGKATLAGGEAVLTVSIAEPGMYVVTADYSGDGANPAASAPPVFLRVVSGGPAFDVNVRSIVSSYYQKILGRTPDPTGLDFWAAEASRLASLGADVREVFFAMAITFFSSSEYLARNASDGQYVTDLYRTFFGRDPDAAGLAYWLGELAAVQSRAAILNSFLFSSEFSGQMRTLFGAAGARPEVDMTIDLFRGALGRLPDSAGFSYWLGRIRAAQCQEAAAVSAEVNAVAALFFNGDEYRARARGASDFVADVYNAYLRRGPGGDSGGFGFWVGQLPTLGRDGVRAAFIPSTEFQRRVAGVVSAGCFGG